MGQEKTYEVSMHFELVKKDLVRQILKIYVRVNPLDDPKAMPNYRNGFPRQGNVFKSVAIGRNCDHLGQVCLAIFTDNLEHSLKLYEDHVKLQLHREMVGS